MAQQNRENIAYIFKEFSQIFLQNTTGAAQMFLNTYSISMLIKLPKKSVFMTLTCT